MQEVWLVEPSGVDVRYINFILASQLLFLLLQALDFLLDGMKALFPFGDLRLQIKPQTMINDIHCSGLLSLWRHSMRNGASTSNIINISKAKDEAVFTLGTLPFRQAPGQTTSRGRALAGSCSMRSISCLHGDA